MSKDTSSTGHGPHRDLDKQQFWREAMRRFDASGQSVREFCKANSLTEPSFYAWRRTLALRDRKVSAPRPSRPPFVELRPQQPMPAAGEAPLEIVAGHRRLLIRRGCGRELLREVLAALEG